jgi:CubicO group peptidase (beta-lactamase class C family)
MAKMTAAQMAKSENAGSGLYIFVVVEDGAVRPANRKDENRKCATKVTGSEQIEGTRLYRVTVGMDVFGMTVQGSQWFDIVPAEDVPVTVSAGTPSENPALVGGSALITLPDVDTYVPQTPLDSGSGRPYSETVGEQNERLSARVAELKAENERAVSMVKELSAELAALSLRLKAAMTEVDEGFTLVADQVGILHAATEQTEDEGSEIVCGTTIRTLTVVATGVHEMHSGRKVCWKCEKITREGAEA